MTEENRQVQWCGYYPGAIGKIVELHATYYHDHWGFDITFETQVARELAEFLSRFDASTDALLDRACARPVRRFGGDRRTPCVHGGCAIALAHR